MCQWNDLTRSRGAAAIMTSPSLIGHRLDGRGGSRRRRKEGLGSLDSDELDQWSIPLNLTVSKLMVWGKQRVQLGGGVRYWIDSPNTGPEGLGYRAQLTFLFPKS